LLKLKTRLRDLLGFVLVTLSGVAAADDATDQMVGGIDAEISACNTAEPKTAKAAQDMLATAVAQRKLDLVSIRKSDAYKAIYNSEANRLLSIPAKERVAACKGAL
jgi:hypothetical protein